MGVEFEKMTEPFIDKDYSSRKGYNQEFLGIEVPMPRAADLGYVAKMEDGNHIIPYEHFSIIMHKERRLALLTAANVDASKAVREPDGKRHTRIELSGLAENDREKWVIDERLDLDFQLSDKFYTYDRTNFDKGHIIRRDDVAWGKTYEELRRANGDTYHVTNCSPQVAIFNRSNKKGEWGMFENNILKQAKSEKLCVFAGPVLDDENDKTFKNRVHKEIEEIQIPSKFWKIIVAKDGEQLQTFAFLLEQDLSQSDVEFNVDNEWIPKMIAVKELEKQIPDIDFPQVFSQNDQFDIITGDQLVDLIEEVDLDKAKPVVSLEDQPVESIPVDEWDDEISPKILEHFLKIKEHGSANKLLDALIKDLDENARKVPPKTAKNVVKVLKNYAWFGKLKTVAEKFQSYAQNNLEVLLHIAQAKIEVGEIILAIDLLTDIKQKLETTLANIEEEDKKKYLVLLSEAIGLLGRAYKQLYIDSKPSFTEPRTFDYQQSLMYYSQGYDLTVGDRDWHGVNKLAMLNHYEKIKTNDTQKYSIVGGDIAREMIKKIKSPKNIKTMWDYANLVQCYLAIGQNKKAIDETINYLKVAEPFDIQSSKRQLIELWLLNDTQAPGHKILPMMDSRYAELGGGPEIIVIEADTIQNYEKVWGDTAYKSLGWLKEAFERAKSVARIGPNSFDGDGTGFLFDGGWIREDWTNKHLLLTNAHVCSNVPEVQQQYPYPASPEDLTATFMSAGKDNAKELRFKSLIWTSPPSDLDATLLELESVPNGIKPPPKVTRDPVVSTKGDARVNILGHPKGYDLRISMQDNRVVGLEEKYIHYRTATDPGSSGSPVFNQRWQLVGLHHASSSKKQANEGIRIDVIIKEIKESLL
jgi:DNA/RNA endonuclease G (NUC1)